MFFLVPVMWFAAVQRENGKTSPVTLTELHSVCVPSFALFFLRNRTPPRRGSGPLEDEWGEIREGFLFSQ